MILELDAELLRMFGHMSIRLAPLATYISICLLCFGTSVFFVPGVRDKETEREKASKGLPPTDADSTHCLTLPKVSIDTKGTNAIWARRLRYIQRQKGLIHAAQPSQGHLLLVRVSGRGDPLYLQGQQDSSLISA